jgi:hypothetical protein
MNSSALAIESGKLFIAMHYVVNANTFKLYTSGRSSASVLFKRSLNSVQGVETLYKAILIAVQSVEKIYNCIRP